MEKIKTNCFLLYKSEKREKPVKFYDHGFRLLLKRKSKE